MAADPKHVTSTGRARDQRPVRIHDAGGLPKYQSFHFVLPNGDALAGFAAYAQDGIDLWVDLEVVADGRN